MNDLRIGAVIDRPPEARNPPTSSTSGGVTTTTICRILLMICSPRGASSHVLELFEEPRVRSLRLHSATFDRRSPSTPTPPSPIAGSG